jgi:hypothetical protein
MFELNSLAACSSASDPNYSDRRDVVDVFGIDASSGDILQMHWEKDAWLRARMRNPYADQGTRFAGPITASALNPDRVNLLGASPKGELLHCYTDPQTWYAEDPRPDSLLPNAQTTAAWWVWTNAGQSRLDLFAVTDDRSGVMQYTAMDPGAGQDYTWSYSPLGNPAAFTNGALTSCSAHQWRIDIFGVQASGNAAQLSYQWGSGWGSNSNLGAVYPVGTQLVSCNRRGAQWDVFGIDENGKILSFYYYWGNGWATRRFDMPVSGDWKLSAGCVRASDQIDLFFLNASSGILRVALTSMDAPTPKVEAEVIYPFLLRNVDLENFKKQFPADKQLQGLSLDDLVKYAQGKDPDGESAEPSSGPQPLSRRLEFTECQWAKGVVLLDVFFLALGWRSLRNKNLALNEAIALGATLPADIDHMLATIADPTSKLFAKANAIREIAALIYSGGLIEPIFKAIVKSLTWWDMVLYGVAGLAEITAVFVTDGAAVYALYAYEISMAGFFVSDVVKAVEACRKVPEIFADQALVALPNSEAASKEDYEDGQEQEGIESDQEEEGFKVD